MNTHYFSKYKISLWYILVPKWPWYLELHLCQNIAETKAYILRYLKKSVCEITMLRNNGEICWAPSPAFYIPVGSLIAMRMSILTVSQTHLRLSQEKS